MPTDEEIINSIPKNYYERKYKFIGTILDKTCIDGHYTIHIDGKISKSDQIDVMLKRNTIEEILKAIDVEEYETFTITYKDDFYRMINNNKQMEDNKNGQMVD